MTDEVRLGNVMVDCGDEQTLQRILRSTAELGTATLFWPPSRAQRRRRRVSVLPGAKTRVPPVWPEKDGCQQKQMHFDFQVDSVPEAVEKALKLGAVKAPAQYGGERFVTLLDPAGHPFCLCRKEKKVSTVAIRRVDSPEEKRRISREFWKACRNGSGFPMPGRSISPKAPGRPSLPRKEMEVRSGSSA